MTDPYVAELAAAFRRKAEAMREAAEKQITAVENFPDVVVRSPETVVALRNAAAIDALAADLEKIS